MTTNLKTSKTSAVPNKKSPAVAAEPVEVATTPETPAKQKKPASAKAEKPAKQAKPHKPKMVRDSFTMPEDDYSKLSQLKAKCLENGLEVKKSELLRAGLIALSTLSASKLVSTVAGVEKLKTGRPKKS